MAKETISALVEGGKATAGAPLGPALGPLGVNIGAVVNKINEETKDYMGMKVPVHVIVDKKTKTFEIEVGSPPVSALLKNKAGIEKGSTEPGRIVAGNISLNDVIEIAKRKREGILSETLKKATKEILGSCVSIGLTVDGKQPKEVLEEIDQGKYDSEFGE